MKMEMLLGRTMKSRYVKDLREFGWAIKHVSKNILFYSTQNKNYIYTMLEIGDHVLTFYTKSEEQAWEEPVQWLINNGYLERDVWQ